MAIFAREIIGRDVVDSHQERLGELKDVVFDTSTGSILALRVKIENDIDVSKLPWEMQDGLIPAIMVEHLFDNQSQPSKPMRGRPHVGISLQLAPSCLATAISTTDGLVSKPHFGL